MNKYKLGTREMVAILLITIGTKFTDATPNLLFPKTYMATWMVPLFAAGMIAIPLAIFLHLLNKYELGLVDLVKKLSGKFVGTVFSSFIFIFYLVGTAFLMSDYVFILSTLYFPQTPDYVILVVLAVVCFGIASGGPYMIGRTAWIVLPYVMIALALLLILAMVEEMDTAYLFPIFGKGLDVVVKESFLKNSIYVETITMATFIPFMTKVKQYSKAAIIGLSILAIEMSFFFMFYVTIFDAYSLEDMLLPFQHLTRVVELGRFISNFEGYFLVFWLIASIVKYTVYLFVTAHLFTQTFNVKSTRFHLIPITTLMVLIGMYPDNLISSSFLYRNTVLHIGSFFFFILPFLLWILSLRKKASASP
ncbi:GerAB/ArcD/ProY family transporter [Bacillus piscicola]|uniref:GerAB/ArcD/ProY family transporter n=1 Tax=Bacillus piscicola TaxID=1632684 RepID=UPI001F08CD82|nr:GerAB/ArcD/ProY family transporter [Bacillus piscicola]